MQSKEIMQQINYAMSYIEDAYDVFAKSKGLNYNSLIVISIICDIKNVTQKQICNIMHLPKTTVHSILLDFIDNEFIYLSVNGENKKEKFVILTPKGKKYFESIISETDEIESRVCKEMGINKCLQIKELLELMGTLLNRETIKYLSSENGVKQNG